VRAEKSNTAKNTEAIMYANKATTRAGINGCSISLYMASTIARQMKVQAVVIKAFPRNMRIDPVIPTAVNLLPLFAINQKEFLAAVQKLSL